MLIPRTGLEVLLAIVMLILAPVWMSIQLLVGVAVVLILAPVWISVPLLVSVVAYQQYRQRHAN